MESLMRICLGLAKILQIAFSEDTYVKCEEVLRNKGSGGGAPVWVWWWVSELSVCSHYTDYTAPTTQTRSRGTLQPGVTI